MTMLLGPTQVLFGLLLVLGTGLVCSGTEPSESVEEIRVKSGESKSNESRVCDTRTCSKLEYYDKLKQKCRDFPGGGILVIMDHSTKCAHGDSGLHTFSRRDYYYVCHPEGVMIGLCPDSTVFSDTEKRCIMQTNSSPSTIKVHDESQNCNIIVPDCSGVGLFPIPSNCTFYFKCQEHNYNFHQYVYQCPPGKVFHPDLLRCSSSNKCYDGHEDILNSFNKDYFPECHILGQFRTAKDCTLYYRCVPNMDGSFYQIRYECPYKMYYNIEKEVCMPEVFHSCDYIPHERIIEDYKQQHSLDASTVSAYPTTVICAINTRITSSVVPATQYETTQPMDATTVVGTIEPGAVREISPVTEQILYTDGTEGPENEPSYATEDEIPYTQEDELPYASEDDGENGIPMEETPQSYEEHQGTTATDDSGGVSAQEWYNTDMVAMSQKSPATEETVGYSDVGDTSRDVDDSVSRDYSLSQEDPNNGYGKEEPIDSNQVSEGTISTTKTTSTRLEDSEAGNDTTTVGTTKRRFDFDYDGMEWDSGAWVLPNRTRAGTVQPSEDYNETNSLEVSGDWSDHYTTDTPSTINPGYSASNADHSCESLAYTAETDPTKESFSSGESYNRNSTTVGSGEFSSVDSGNGSTSSIEYTGSSRQHTSGTSSSSAWNALELNCHADTDGEIVCNGQKLSVNGYLEILGFTLQLRKWADVAVETLSEPGPTVNIHLSLQHPFNYMLEARSTQYRSSFSYELSTTTELPVETSPEEHMGT